MGKLGDTVKVKGGYARNFLIPHGKALFATEENIKDFAARRAELERAAADSLGVAESRAARINELPELTVSAPATEEGKLFGSVNVREIAEAISAAGVEIERNEISLPEGAIHRVGEYDVEILLHTDVTATIKLIVVAQA